MSDHQTVPNKLSLSIVPQGYDRVLAINFPQFGKVRARRIVTRSRRRPTGKYPSWKMNRNLEWESPHELNALRLLDCDPKILSFHDQPCEIVYVQAGEQRRHYPDILVQFASNGSKEIWEVKTEDEASRPEVASRTALMTEHLPAWGYQYRIALAGELSLQPRLRNSCNLLYFGRNSITEDAREKIRRAVAAGKELNWSSACAGKYGPRGREVLCRLTLEGYLNVDMNSRWSKETEFSPAGGSEW